MSDSVADVIEPVPGEPVKKPKGDLGVRTVSAAVMIAVAGTALLLGGLWLDVLVAVVAAIAFYEFAALVWKIELAPVVLSAAILAGAIYVALAAATLVRMDGLGVFMVIGLVVAVDTFAYFSGRKFGGPKIAPSISPSKTWAGLIGGAVGAGIFLILFSRIHDAPLCEWYYSAFDSFEPPPPPGTFFLDDRCHIGSPPMSFRFTVETLLWGTMGAVIAQGGDFFESWIKRKAGVKDSSALIPGHGGVFDRVDGLIAVAFVLGLASVVGFVL
jgi:phosphatidate cytidylyltransferase